VSDLRLAVVGATGAVGPEVLSILAQRGFPASEVVPFASARSAGRRVPFAGGELEVRELTEDSLAGFDLALFSAGGGTSERFAPEAVRRGCVVVDKSSAFRMHPDVPLVVPEVNGHVLDTYMAQANRKNIIANPNCSTAQMVVALKPLHDFATIKRVVVATYQSVSGAGKEGIDELYAQTKGIFVNDKPTPKKFPKQIAFNVIPHIDVFMEDGYTKEEWKMLAETKKILDPKIKLSATCVRVPVFVGHSEAVNIEFEKPISADEARDILREAPGVQVIDKREPGGYVTAIETVGDDDTYVSRIREDVTVENGLAMWIVSDNLRKGAATNAVQIAETILERGLFGRKAA